MSFIEDMKQLKRNSQQFKIKLNNSWYHHYSNNSEEYKKWRYSQEGTKFVENQLKVLNDKCPLCHTKLTVRTATLDHLLPKSKFIGLSCEIDNFLIMCKSCNEAKCRTDFHIWYQRLPSTWKQRLKTAITAVHGENKFDLMFIKSRN